jgi:hypothetical protein
MGIDDDIKRMMDTDAAMRRAIDPYGAIGNQLRSDVDLLRLSGMDSTMKATIDRMAEEQRSMRDLAVASGLVNVDTGGVLSFAKEFQEQAKLLQGIMPDYQRLGLLDAVSPLRDSMNEMMLASKKFAEQFRMPEMTEFGRLSKEIAAASKIAAGFGGFELPNGTLTEAMKAMHSPWLLRDDVMRSAHAFAEMQQIGRAVGTIAPFDESLARSLRGALGDWRDVTILPTPILDNVIARTDFYVGLGFDSSLTDFTAEAFDESSKLAGLAQEPEEGDEEENGLVRTNRAHAQLMRFERSVRRFIDAVMKAEFGEDWLRRQLPGGMFEAWKEKRTIALEKGEQEQPLIAYADFTDYIKIIERKDNWARVFKAIFRRQSDVQESFFRLFPVRICTMHARLITLDDELLLQVETRRLGRAFTDFF